VEKYLEPGRAQIPKGRLQIACCISKNTDTLTEYEIFISHCNNDYTKVLEYHIMRTLPVVSSTYRIKFNYSHQSSDL